jgi:hypothetical protein
MHKVKQPFVLKIEIVLLIICQKSNFHSLTLYGQGCKIWSIIAFAFGYKLVTIILRKLISTEPGLDISQKSFVMSSKPGWKWFV